MLKPLFKKPVIKCKHYELDYSSKTLIMGILNVNPDSFSDEGRYNQMGKAISHAKEMVKNGAHIIDIDGESTRPGSKKVTLEEELELVIPIVRELSNCIPVPISVDTYKAEVAKQAIEAGAHIINDIWGAKVDTAMASVAATYEVPIILTHNRPKPNYVNLIEDMISDLQESIDIVKLAGVKDKQIILDPGIGFAKTFEDNLYILQNLNRFTELGYPILLATSRKSVDGKVLKLPPQKRLEGTAACIHAGISQGVQIVRVHNVLEIGRFVRMADVLTGKDRSLLG